MFVSPMLLRKIDEPFDDNQWLSELKLDGIRFLYSSMEGVKFYTRHNNEVTDRFPELNSNEIPKGTILDGEIIQADSEGKPDFEELMSRFQTKNLNKIKSLSQGKPITYCVFDIIYHQGKKVTNLPLVERKALLDEIIPDGLPRITKTLSIEGKGKALFRSIQEQNLEGVVLKKKDSKYEIGKRSAFWLKVINYQYTTVSITGFRKLEFGWLLQFQDGRPAGILELVPTEARKAVYQVSRMVPVKETKDFVYFPNDSLQCRIKYRTLTKSGMLRIPVFIDFVA